MKRFGMYAYEDSGPSTINFCSSASDAAPLILNCAGNFHSQFPFKTDNPGGRLDYYLMHITAGELTVYFEDSVRILGAGATVLFPPHYHYRYSYDGKGEALNYLWAHFTGSHAAFYLHELGFDPLPSVYLAEGETSAVMLFGRLFDIFPKEDRFRPLALASVLEQILISLARSSLSRKEQNPVIRSLRYIHASYTTDIKIPDLAAMESLSHSRYNVLFRAATGTSPKQYITDLRMRHACELLRTTDMSVKQIGVLVGYHDAHFFGKLFKASFGCTPQKYRADQA